MRRNSIPTPWQLRLLCLLAALCWPSSPVTEAQTRQSLEEKRLGLPPGYTLIEGDIQVPIEFARALRQLKPDAPQATIGTKFWPNGIVPFEFDNPGCGPVATATCVTDANQNAMRNAMAVLAAVANVHFQNCADNKCSGDYVHVQASVGNSSAVGVKGGQQFININSWGSQFTMVHELLHCLGFYHEQSRPTRDNFVTIKCGNIQGDNGDCQSMLATNNFNKINSATYRDYDFDSLMHYGQCDFSKNDGTIKDASGALVPACPALSAMFPDGGITIDVKPPNRATWQTQIGQRNHLSTLDRLSLMGIYPQPNWRFVDANYLGLGLPGFEDSFSYGFLLQPYVNLATAINATPPGGVLFMLPGTYFLNTPVSKAIELRAPLGDAVIRQRSGAAVETLATTSAASYYGELTSESIAALFGTDLSNSTAVATTLPLPTMLAGVTVKVKDSAETERIAPLFFVSQFQINYLVPVGTKEGLASVTVFNNGNLVANGTIPILNTAPAMFSANANGSGVAAALALRVHADAQITEPIARFDAQLQRYVPLPIDVGPEGDQVFLILFGTGFRAANGLATVGATVGGESSEVLYAGPAPGFAGLDQANLRLPRNLAGKGEVGIVLTANRRSSNPVTVSIR